MDKRTETVRYAEILMAHPDGVIGSAGSAGSAPPLTAETVTPPSTTADILSDVRILVVEDDEDLRFAAAAALRGSGFAVDEADDLPVADTALFVNSYDCVVFDRMLPSGDSLDHVRWMRTDGQTTPVLFLTSRDSVADRVEGLGAGDDYLVKPFAVPELIARVRNLCRRITPVRPPVVRYGDLEIDTSTHTVHRDGVLLSLTTKEFAVLEILAIRPGEAVRRAELIERCWDEFAEPNSNVVEVLVSQLRRKLGEPSIIHTVRGVGYRLEFPG